MVRKSRVRKRSKQRSSRKRRLTSKGHRRRFRSSNWNCTVPLVQSGMSFTVRQTPGTECKRTPHVPKIPLRVVRSEESSDVHDVMSKQSPRSLHAQLDGLPEIEYITPPDISHCNAPKIVGAGQQNKGIFVYKCQGDTVSFAIKYFDRTSTDSTTEIRIHQKLQKDDVYNHCILKILGIADNPPKMYLEYGIPMDIEDYKRWNKVKDDEKLQAFRSVQEGIKYMHEHHIVHRDIKFANLLVVDGKVKITDFGISRLLKPGDRATTMKGTPLFMSPAVMRTDIFGGYSYECDLWSLGIMILMTLSNNYSDNPLVGHRSSVPELGVAMLKIDSSKINDLFNDMTHETAPKATLRKMSQACLQPTLTILDKLRSIAV